MIIYEYITIFCTVLFLPLLVYFIKKEFQHKSEKMRVEGDLKLYYDEDFKQCIEILSNRLTKTEFEEVCNVFYNLMRGYDYGFTESINFAFYKEMKLIQSNRKQKIPNKICKLKVVNNN